MDELNEKKKAVEVLINNNFMVDNEILLKLEKQETLQEILALPPETTEQEIKDILFPPSKDVKIIKSYKEVGRKRKVDDFIAYFNTRYQRLKEILQKKQELQEAISIKRVLDKTEKENITIIGMVYEKNLTKNNNIMLTLEDPTGRINVVVNNRKSDLFRIAQDCVCDEVIGLVGACGSNVIFANSIVLPEIPPTKELKKGPNDCYAVFTGDQHVGADQFLREKFDNFIAWLNCEVGSEEQKEIAKKTKYLFLVGDLVDGVGIHPAQFDQLEIKDVKEQYSKLAEELQKIPGSIEIVVCPGNHDALRLMEPQPSLNYDYAGKLQEMPNVHMVSNPAVVNIDSTENFDGFDILLYHGASFHYYAENVASISSEGGATRADLIMKFLLQKRHLAPEHTSVTYSPRAEEDPLLIESVPDFFITGHIHRSTISTYRNITLVNCSCWIGMTDFQEKVGLVPEPGRAVAVNLRTRETKVIKF